MKKIFYIQTENVDWLENTKKGEIWVHMMGTKYIQILDHEKRTNFGIDSTLVEPLNEDLTPNKDFVFREITENEMYIQYLKDNGNDIIQEAIEDYLLDHETIENLSNIAIDNNMMSKRVYEKRTKIQLIFLID